MNSDYCMSRPDYQQTIIHHSHLLVLLCGVGPSKPRSLQKLFDKVRRIDHLKITDSNGLVRDIWLRYIHDHPVENNDWGDFQTHRRLLGLITIGKFDTQNQLNELCRQHESLKVRYGTTLYESRAIFLGPASNQPPTQVNNIPATHDIDANDIDEGKNEKCAKNKENSLQMEMEVEVEIENSEQIRLQDEFTTPHNFKARALFYRENEAYDNLDEHMIDFITALFWILESKRLERSREKVEKCNLLTAPFESREVVGLNMESRNNRKRILGRITKNLADLSLQAGLMEDALSLYHSAYDTLKSIMDSLWVGATEEGLCSASACLLYPHLRTEQIFTNRKASLQIGSTTKNTTEKWRSADLSPCVNSMEKPAQEQLEPKSPPPLSSSNSSVSSILTHSTLSQSSTNSSSTSTSITATTHGRNGHGELPGNILKPEELPIFFQRAIINYSKYRHAAIVEIEASFKSARISVEQNRSLDVAMVLQNILFINHSLTEQERIRIFEVITSLFEQIGYRRKAAFFQRLAALKHFQNTPRPDWLQTYRLLFNSMSGYMLSADPLEVLQTNTGWPALQINLLQYLITAATRLGHSTLATRHMTFLLQTQWQNMSAKEQSEMALQLQNYSAQCEGSPVPLVLDNGTIIPPANLTDLPYCLQMIVKDLPPHLKPQRLKTAIADKGPFLFTPLQFNTIDRRDKTKERNKIAFYWVQNNRSEIAIRLQNPLPFELIINDMRLLTKGVVFKSLAESLTMQPNQITWATLHGTPLEVGELDIQGYSTHTLGVKSNCRLKHMYHRKFPPNYLVNILPDLPCIAVKTSLPQTASFSNMPNKDIVVTTASLTLYHGETSTCVITITNETSVPVEHFEVIITSNVHNDLQTQIFHINHDDIQRKLPIAAQSSIDFEVNIFAQANFIYSHCSLSNSTLYAFNCSSLSPADSYTVSMTANHTSLPIRIGTGDDGAAIANQIVANNKRNQSTYSSFRSTNSAIAPLSGTLSLPPTNVQNDVRIQQEIDAQLLLKYSGGDCMQDGFCRQCAIYMKLEFLPSVQITKWDVLPAEIPSQFYLVLDVTNLTNQEMSLNYANGKTIVIEAQENCRVPVPVERCPLEEISVATETLFSDSLQKDLCDRSPMISYNEIVSDLCSKHIADRVKIHWLLTGMDIKGIASLKGITLTQAMIDLCCVSPLLWNISFKKQSILPQSEVVCVAGQSSELSISICNQSLHPLKNLILTIRFYQDYLNGIQNYNLDTRVAISGPSRLLIPILQRNEEMRHECTVVFFTPGRFKASIQCHAKRVPLVNATKPLLTRSCPVPQHQHQHQYNGHHSMMTTLSRSVIHNAVHSDSNSEDHIWKFIPPIEVTVVES